MTRSDKIAFTLTVAFVLIVMIVVVHRMAFHHHFVRPANAHEHGETADDRVADFYKTWKRPKGMWPAMAHRVSSCCYSAGVNQDCFPVLKQRRNAKGELEVQADVTGAHTEAMARYGSRWFTVNTQVEEHLQPDPRTSPDGRSHVCIAGGETVVCYVEAWGG